MTVRCGECNGSVTWDDDAGSAICTTCGTLTDPTQSILTSHLDPSQKANTSGLWDPAASTTLKSFRTGSNWDLSGQGSEAKVRKNNFAMVEFINCLASSVKSPTLAPRATVLFNQAMATGRYRWGRKSKLVAGACLALALRECKRPDALCDVAYLLGETFPTLVRTLTSVTAALGLSFTASDPTVYIPCLQTHLSSLLENGSRHSASDATMPSSLMDQLKPLSLHAAAATATSLSALFARFGPDHHINLLPVSPTACALFMLALEAELRSPIERLGDLAASLGPRCHVQRGVVMSRYKLVQEEVLVLVDQVPWLDKYQTKRGRAKVGKRTLVAKGLRDVLLFQEEIWRGQLKPTVVLDISDSENGDYPSDPQSEDTFSSAPPSLDGTKGRPDVRHYSHFKKRRKISHQPLYDAAQFLLDPFSAPIPSFGPVPMSVPLESADSQIKLSISHSCPPSPSLVSPAPADGSPPPEMPTALSAISHSYTPSSSSQPNTLTRPPSLPLTSYLLNAPTCAALTSRHPPTRLQLLAASRRGEEEITDEELFGEEELEKLFRSEEEIESLRESFGWGDWEDQPDEVEEGRRARKRRKRKGAGGLLEEIGNLDGDKEVQSRKVSKRVNLEALARFLEDPTEEKDDQYGYDAAFLGLQRFDDEHEDEKDDDDDDWPVRAFHGLQDEISAVPGSDIVDRPCTPTGTSRGPTTMQDDGEVVLDGWRPLSPTTGIRYSGHGRYDEEYD